MTKIKFNWSEPRRLTKTSNQYVRDLKIPSNMLSDFFEYWKQNKKTLYKKGYRVQKDHVTSEWVICHYIDDISEFYKNSKKSVKSNKSKQTRDVANIAEYKVKDTSKLRPWQVDAVSRIVRSIKEYGAAIDGSDTGIGKSYSACGVARELNYNIFIICPKAVKESWRRVIRNHFRMWGKTIGIINYESLKSKNNEFVSRTRNKKSLRMEYVWKIPKNTLFVWDEAQKLKNYKTQNSKLCISAFKNGYKMLFCSATIATNPLELKTVGQCLKLFESERKFYPWAYDHGVEKGRFGLEFNGTASDLNKIHKTIFSTRGIRLSRDSVENFPESQVIAECYEMDKQSTSQINKIYKEMKSELSKVKSIAKKTKNSNALVALLRARQEVELLKVPIFIEMAEDAIENNMSVVIFCNFTDTINSLASRLNTTCIIDGNHVKSRQQSIDDFQSDKERIMLVGISAGGSGLSLHDLNGNHPRLALISPSYSAVLMRQALGRVWRDGAKTKSLQRIVFISNTIEEQVCARVNQKLNNLDLINDGDLTNGIIV